MEPTAKGSGNAAARQDAIKGLKKQHEEGQKLRVAEVLDAAFLDYGHGRSECAKIHRNDVDDGKFSPPTPSSNFQLYCTGVQCVWLPEKCVCACVLVFVCVCVRGDGFFVHNPDVPCGEGG